MIIHKGGRQHTVTMYALGLSTVVVAAAFFFMRGHIDQLSRVVIAYFSLMGVLGAGAAARNFGDSLRHRHTPPPPPVQDERI